MEVGQLHFKGGKVERECIRKGFRTVEDAGLDGVAPPFLSPQSHDVKMFEPR